MANSTSNIDAISVSQASKEVTANAFFDAASQAATYGRRASTSSGLTWGYYGGNVVKSDGSLVQIANGTLTLTASATNYIVSEKATGAVSAATNTTNWNNTTDYWRLYSVEAGSSTVTSYTDSRTMGAFQGAGSGGGGGMTNPMTTSGDIITGGASGVPQRLGSGSNGQVLKVVSGVPAWATLGSGTGTVDAIVAGTGISVDDTDPANPIISATGGGAASSASDVLLSAGSVFANVQLYVDSASEDIVEFSPPWGLSPDVDIGAAHRAMSGSTASPVISISSEYTATGAIPVDFSGAAGGTIANGIYVQHKQTGSSTANNAFSHGIMSYALNAASGDNDVVATSGRARKIDVAGGVGDSCGVWGSAYQESTKNGGVMGLEAHIYQNVTGQAAQDMLGSKWSVGVHVLSASMGSPAHAGVNIDGAGESAGQYGFWNGIVIERNCFHGAGIAGTVGINTASWNENYHPQYGWKVGNAGRHIYRGNAPFSVEASTLLLTNASGSAGVRANASGVNNAYFDLISGGALKGQWFYDGLAGDVKVGTVGNIGLKFRTNETYRGAFSKYGDFLVNQTDFNNGVGFGFSPTGYSAWYRDSTSPTDGILDVFSNWGSVKRNVLRIQSNGDVLNYNNSYGAISDERLKENIKPSRDFLQALMGVQVREYSMKSDCIDRADRVGVIAQELEHVFPFLVGETADGVKNVTYSQFIPLLIKAIQELKSELDSLNNSMKNANR